jgi:hypothetical protein
VAGGFTPVTITARFDGTATFTENSAYAAFLEVALGPVGSPGVAAFTLSRQHNARQNETWGSSSGNLVSFTPVRDGDDWIARAVYNVYNTAPTLTIGGRLYAVTQGDALADFGHTARFGIEVPEGVTFTSSSGIFLSAVQTAVPEPGTWLMMLVGFALIGSGLRQVQRAPAAFA